MVVIAVGEVKGEVTIPSSELGQTEASPSKLAQLRRALEEEQKKSEAYLQRLMYLQADFENYRKRVEREIGEAEQLGSERLASSLLGIIDELELAVQAGEAAKGKDSIMSGVGIILKKLYEILEREGLTKIEAIGRPFDPAMHEAFSKVTAEGQAEGTIVEEVRKGFMLKGKVIRPSKVKVALAQTTPSYTKKEPEGAT